MSVRLVVAVVAWVWVVFLIQSAVAAEQQEALEKAPAEFVSCVGVAIAEELTPREARVEALNRCRRDAVEEVAGVNVESESLVMNFTTIIDHIRNWTTAHVAEERDVKWREYFVEGLPAFEVRMKVRVVKEPFREDPSLELDIQMNRSVYHPGDPMQVSVTMARPVYLTILNVLEGGELILLYPNHFVKQDPVGGASSPWHFPSREDVQRGLELVAALPDGKRSASEAYIAIASTGPLNVSELQSADTEILNAKPDSPSFGRLLERVATGSEKILGITSVAYEIRER